MTVPLGQPYNISHLNFLPRVLFVFPGVLGSMLAVYPPSGGGPSLVRVLQFTLGIEAVFAVVLNRVSFVRPVSEVR